MAPPAPKPKTKGGRSALADVVAREYTIHLHKRVRQFCHRLWLGFTGYGKRKRRDWKKAKNRKRTEIGSGEKIENGKGMSADGSCQTSRSLAQVSRSELPRPSRRSRRSLTRLWYAPRVYRKLKIRKLSSSDEHLSDNQNREPRMSVSTPS